MQFPHGEKNVQLSHPQFLVRAKGRDSLSTAKNCRVANELVGALEHELGDFDRVLEMGNATVDGVQDGNCGGGRVSGGRHTGNMVAHKAS